MNINDGSVCRDLSSIQQSFEKGDLHEKEWDKDTHQLKELTGGKFIEAKIKHFFSSTYEETRFQEIFDDCINDRLSSERNFQRTPDLSTDAKAFKGISHYIKVSRTIEIPQNLHNLTQSIEHDLMAKRNELSIGEREFDEVEVIQKQEEISELYDLENEYDEQSRQSKETLEKYRYTYNMGLPIQAILAHEVYHSIWNSQESLQTANDYTAKLSTLLASEDRNVRSYALGLVSYVKYGGDAPEIRAGSENPSFFWDVKRLWNTVRWVFTGEMDVSKKDGFDTLNGPKKVLIDKLYNKPFEMMGDSLVTEYTDPTLGIKYPNRSFVTKYYPVGGKIAGDLEGNDFFTQQKDFLFVPYVFKPVNPLYPDHIVLVIFNRKARQIQYYDSQALPPDHPDRCARGFNMLEELSDLCHYWNEQEGTDDIQIVANPIIHQEDIINCGPYVCDAIRRILQGETFENLCRNGKNNDKITQVRFELAEDILEFQPPDEGEYNHYQVVKEGDEFTMSDDDDSV